MLSAGRQVSCMQICSAWLTLVKERQSESENVKLEGILIFVYIYIVFCPLANFKTILNMLFRSFRTHTPEGMLFFSEIACILCLELQDTVKAMSYFSVSSLLFRRKSARLCFVWIKLCIGLSFSLSLSACLSWYLALSLSLPPSLLFFKACSEETVVRGLW